jgi:hypothetical protein
MQRSPQPRLNPPRSPSAIQSASRHQHLRFVRSTRSARCENCNCAPRPKKPSPQFHPPSKYRSRSATQPASHHQHLRSVGSTRSVRCENSQLRSPAKKPSPQFHPPRKYRSRSATQPASHHQHLRFVQSTRSVRCENSQLRSPAKSLPRSSTRVPNIAARRQPIPPNAPHTSDPSDPPDPSAALSPINEGLPFILRVRPRIGSRCKEQTVCFRKTPAPLELLRDLNLNAFPELAHGL